MEKERTHEMNRMNRVPWAIAHMTVHGDLLELTSGFFGGPSPLCCHFGPMCVHMYRPGGVRMCLCFAMQAIGIKGIPMRRLFVASVVTNPLALFANE